MRVKTGSKAGTAAVLMIFCVFAMSVLAVLMLGADVYKNMNESSQEDYNKRVCLSYIWSKAKNKDDGGGFYAGEFHGLPALIFNDVFGGRLYKTVIYAHDGVLRELFFEDGLSFNPGDGEAVAKLDRLSVTEDGRGFIIVQTLSNDAGRNNPVTDSIVLTPRGGPAGGGLDG
jgi:hypothetical protein